MSSNVTYTPPSVSFSETSHPTKSPRESHVGGTFKATRTLECAWSDRLTLMKQLLTAYKVTLPNGRVITYGDKYPHKSRVYVTDVSSIEGYGDPSASDGNTQWAKARLTVDYAPRNFDPDEEDEENLVLYEETFDFESVRLVRPGSMKLFWADGSVVEDMDSPTHTRKFMRWALSWTEQGPLPATFANVVDKCNSEDISSRVHNMSFAAETLLYEGPSIRQTTFEDGELITDVTLNFLHTQPGTWNQSFRPGKTAPETLYTDTGGSTPFVMVQTADFVSAFNL